MSTTDVPPTTDAPPTTISRDEFEMKRLDVEVLRARAEEYEKGLMTANAVVVAVLVFGIIVNCIFFGLLNFTNLILIGLIIVIESSWLSTGIEKVKKNKLDLEMKEADLKKYVYVQ